MRDWLKGLFIGPAQRVGAMTMIPLFSDEDLYDKRFVAPVGNWLRYSTSNYGVLHLENQGAKETIVPAHTAFMTKQRAQDHATMKTLLVKPGAHVRHDRAVCVQSHQGGTIAAEDTTKLHMLPFPVRWQALQPALYEGTRFDRMWVHLQREGFDDMLANYYDSHEKEMNEFVGEFECNDEQIGAVVLLGNEVVGVERSPNPEYWAAVWRPLLRDCYGSVALRPDLLQAMKMFVRKNVIPDVPGTLAQRVGLANAYDADEEKAIFRSLLNDASWQIQDTEVAGDAVVKTLASPTMAGQMVTVGDEGQVVYLSIVRKPGAFKQSAWSKAKTFDL